MTTLQIENVSVWTNKFQGSVKFHMKEKSESGDKSKYIFLNEKEATMLVNKLTLALSGTFSEIEVRSGIVPITLYMNQDGTFFFIYGGQKAGYQQPKAKITFSKDGMIMLRDSMKMFVESMKALGKIDQKDVKKLEKFTKDKNVKKQELKPKLERQNAITLPDPIELPDISNTYPVDYCPMDYCLNKVENAFNLDFQKNI